MAYLGTIGKRFQASDFEDILIEADIVAPGLSIVDSVDITTIEV